MNDTASHIEALLFSEGGPIAKKRLATLLKIDAKRISDAALILKERLAERGLTLIETETELALAIRSEMKETIEEVFQRSMGEQIGDAGLEVLSIILYRGPSTRAQIDYIRGVNTSSTIRTLTARGLVERTQNPDDAREYLYRPTTELLAHLGVSSSRELPDYDKIAGELAAFEKERGPFEDHGTEHSTENAQ